MLKGIIVFGDELVNGFRGEEPEESEGVRERNE